MPSSPTEDWPEDVREYRKRNGIYYTPAPIAEYLVNATLDQFTLSHSTEKVSGPLFSGEYRFGVTGFPRIFDPACGDGAILWQAYLWLCQHYSQTHSGSDLGPEILSIDKRCSLIQCLYGIDEDSQAIENLRNRFRSELIRFGVTPEQAERLLTHQFRWGNPLLSPKGSPTLVLSELHPSETQGHLCPAIEIARAFPEVFEDQGFDAVIANPPYRRERGAKLDRSALTDSTFWMNRRIARMDLWHYFFHLSLDALRNHGMLAFLVNSYWTSSQAGYPLVQRLRSETLPIEFVELETAPIFENVTGRHLIMRVEKSQICDFSTYDQSGERLCRISRWNAKCDRHVLQRENWQLLQSINETDFQADQTAPFFSRSISLKELFRDNRINLRPESTFRLERNGHLPLCELFEVRQGIAENPPRITRKQSLADSSLRKGEGVFVLTSEEVDRLQLSENERYLVRPYYETAVLQRFYLPESPTHWLLYLTRETAPRIEILPNLERHLIRFRPLLEQRREVRLGKTAWWHLHWPREERLFEQPRILAVQMGAHPRFVEVARSAYVGFSVNVICHRSAESVNCSWPEPDEFLSLRSLSAILNSRCAADWFEVHAKRRGVNLDIGGSVLKAFPLPSMNRARDEELRDLIELRYQIRSNAKTCNPKYCPDTYSENDALIDEYVQDWYSNDS